MKVDDGVVALDNGVKLLFHVPERRADTCEGHGNKA